MGQENRNSQEKATTGGTPPKSPREHLEDCRNLVLRIIQEAGEGGISASSIDHPYKMHFVQEHGYVPANTLPWVAGIDELLNRGLVVEEGIGLYKYVQQ